MKNNVKETGKSATNTDTTTTSTSLNRLKVNTLFDEQPRTQCKTQHANVRMEKTGTFIQSVGLCNCIRCEKLTLQKVVTGNGLHDSACVQKSPTFMLHINYGHHKTSMGHQSKGTYCFFVWLLLCVRCKNYDIYRSCSCVFSAYACIW